MTDKKSGLNVADPPEIKEVALQNVFGGNRPYYWSWYRIVFEEPDAPVRGTLKIPPH